MIRKAERQSWKTFCNKIGRTIPLGDVWNIIRSTGGIGRDWQYPVLKKGEEIVISVGEKAEMRAKAPIKIHSWNNWTEGKRGRLTRSAHPGILGRRNKFKSLIVQ